MDPIHQHRLPNGLWLLAEPVAGAQSLALTLLLPAGVSTEPDGQQGVGAILAEMVNRGAGGLDARAHSDALDQLGVQRGTGVETHYLRLGAAMIGSKLGDALPLLLDMACRPQLLPAALEPSRDLALQALASLEDEPQQRVFLELRERHFPAPFGRSPLGRKADLEALTATDVRRFWEKQFVPGRSILGLAGRFDWPRVCDQVARLTENWKGTCEPPAAGAVPPRGHLHQANPSTQVHIGLAYDAPPEVDERSILAKAAVAVLSGGMSGRLFTQVREKRGLCYAVGARYSGDKERGSVMSYAGTTAPRAQETLDVLVAELRRLSQGVEADEFARALVGMKASLVMQGESTGARSASIAADQAIHGRPRSLDELAALVDSVTLEKLVRYVAENPPGPMTVVTIGPGALVMA